MPRNGWTSYNIWFRPLANYVPQQDATTVARLKQAGAIVLAKTNPAKLAGDYQTDNPVFGRTNNPWNLNYTTGGSSGGSAAAIAAGFSPLELGSDIAGSIRHPAHCCGVYGLKPTDRLVPTTGHIPELPGMARAVRHLLSIGPLARSIADLKLCLSLIAGADERQPEIPPVALDLPSEKLVSDYRIAWTDQFDDFAVSRETRQALHLAINKIAESGVQVEPASPENFDFNEALSTYSALISLELYASLPLSREFWDGVSTLFQTEFYDRTQTAFKQGTPISRGGIRAVPPTLPKYAAILTERDRFIALMDAFINQWDAWICPVAISPAFTHRSFAQPIEVDSVKVPYLLACGAYTMIFNFTGHPVVVIPIGQTQAGLPIGMQIVGRRWQDFQVLAIAEKLSEIIGEFPHPPGY